MIPQLHRFRSALTLSSLALFACALAVAPLTVRGSAPDPAHAEKTSDDKTPADVFEAMRKGFHPAAAKGVHAHYQFDISGPNGGNWWIIVNDGEFSMGKGVTENPDVTMASSDRDWVMLSAGTLGGFRAYITGRLKVKGDQGLARKLDEMFP